MPYVFEGQYRKMWDEMEKEAKNVPEKPDVPERRDSSTGNIIQEYSEKLAQALRLEAESLKERMEQDTGRMVAKAREESEAITGAAKIEAQQIVDDARKQAEECTRTVEQAQQEAAQLLGEVDSLLAQARQKIETGLAEIIAKMKNGAGPLTKQVIAEAPVKATEGPPAAADDSHEKLAQLIARIDDAGTADNTPSEVSSGTGNKPEKGAFRLTDCLPGEMEKAGGQEADDEAGFGHLADAAAEAEKKWKMLTETLGIETVMSSRQSTDKAVTAVSVSKKTEVTAHYIEHGKKDPVKENNDNRVFKGALNLEIAPPFDPLILKNVQEYLGRIPNLRILSTGGYTRKDEMIATYIVDLKKPMPFLESLKAIPSVVDVTEYNGKIIITLKGVERRE